MYIYMYTYVCISCTYTYVYIYHTCQWLASVFSLTVILSLLFSVVGTMD